jgi:cation:H+ antiporter
MTYLLFVFGFVLLIKGADFLVEGASSIAKKYKLSDMVIGLTIISFGTSMPELLVNLMASFGGSSELAIGNVFGSNIANILLILGISAIIFPLPINKSTYFSEIPFSLIATLLVGFLANASLLIDNRESLMLSQIDGAIMLVFFVLFLGYIIVVSRQEESQVQEEITMLPMGKSTLFVVGGIIALFFGGKWVVDGAVDMAHYFNLSESFIGLTVVAVGTSLPELVTSAVAAYKKKTDIAVGNVVGSNIFNLLWILGLSAVIKPLPFDVVSNEDILMIIASSTLLIFAVVVGKRTVIERWEGVLFLIAYIAYTWFLIQRG